MTFTQFLDKYCADIIGEVKQRESNPFSGLFSQEVENGVSLIFDDAGNDIAVEDITGLSVEDFQRVHPEMTALDAYNYYMSCYTRVTGQQLIDEHKERFKGIIDQVQTNTVKAGDIFDF